MAGAESMATKIACMVLVCLVVATPHVEAITCGQVVTNLIPCLEYLRSGKGPTPQCCGGVRAVNNLAQTTADRKTACGCLKSAASSYGVGAASYAGNLPTRCGVNIPYKISPSTDCNKIQ